MLEVYEFYSSQCSGRIFRPDLLQADKHFQMGFLPRQYRECKSLPLFACDLDRGTADAAAPVRFNGRDFLRRGSGIISGTDGFS